MTSAKVCPVCEAQQDAGLLCSACCDRLERELGDVAAIVAELDVTLSRQDRISSSSGGGESDKAKSEDSGLAPLKHTRSPINVRAMTAADDLQNTLTTWARDLSGETWLPEVAVVVVKRDPDATTEGPFCLSCPHRSCQKIRAEERRLAAPIASQAAWMLLGAVPAIRRHPAVAELVDEVTDAIAQARRAVDRPADREYLSQCMVETPDDEGRMVTCLAELYARKGASEVRCKVCGITHDVTERRVAMLERARDMLFTVKEAAQMVGDVGGIRVTEASIRGYVHRGRIGYHTGTLIRLGDLLAVVVDEGERKTA